MPIVTEKKHDHKEINSDDTCLHNRMALCSMDVNGVESMSGCKTFTTVTISVNGMPHLRLKNKLLIFWWTVIIRNKTKVRVKFGPL
jgi:hypothetical protein